MQKKPTLTQSLTCLNLCNNLSSADKDVIKQACNTNKALLEQLEKDKSRLERVRAWIANATAISMCELVDYIKQCEAEIEVVISKARGEQ